MDVDKVIDCLHQSIEPVIATRAGTASGLQCAPALKPLHLQLNLTECLSTSSLRTRRGIHRPYSSVCNEAHPAAPTNSDDAILEATAH